MLPQSTSLFDLPALTLVTAGLGSAPGCAERGRRPSAPALPRPDMWDEDDEDEDEDEDDLFGDDDEDLDLDEDDEELLDDEEDEEFEGDEEEEEAPEEGA